MMPKRFHPRETALLMAPVLMIGAIGLWQSKRPKPPIDDGKLHPQFHLDKPSALEAFGGANAALMISFKGDAVKHFDIWQLSPYLQVKTSRGVEVAHQNSGSNLSWDKNLWNSVHGSSSGTRYLIRTDGIPAGEMHFGFFAIAQPNSSFAASTTASAPLKPVRLSGKWKVDRTQFKPTNLASWPRKPFIKVREVVITEKTVGKPRSGVNEISGEIVFDLQSAAMDEKTSFESSFSEHHFTPPGQTTYGMSYYGTGQTTAAAPRTRVRFWTVHSKSPKTQLNVSGRVSADNRWPLGFAIEPFSYQNVRIGQKLKVKSFPIPLPQP